MRLYSVTSKPLSGKFDPSGIQKIQIQVSYEKQYPAQKLQSVHQGLPGEWEIFLDGFHDGFQVVELGTHAVLPILQIELVLDHFIQFGRVPIADQQQILLGALEIEHDLQPVLHDLADQAAGGTRPPLLLKEALIDLVEHLLDGLVQHPVAQKLVIPDFEQGNVRGEVAIRRNNHRSLPIHEGQLPGGIARPRDQDFVDLLPVEHLALGADKVGDGEIVLLDPFVGRWLRLLDQQDGVLLE